MIYFIPFVFVLMSVTVVFLIQEISFSFKGLRLFTNIIFRASNCFVFNLLVGFRFIEALIKFIRVFVKVFIYFVIDP